MRILLTGSNGFIGKRVLSRTSDKDVVACSRKGDSSGVLRIGNIDSSTDWGKALNGVDVVVHCAARVHVMSDNSEDPLAEFLEMNVDGTANLATQAANSGVKRFIFISTIKVNGEQSTADGPFTPFDQPAPEDYYGVSKLEAERALQKVCCETGMEFVIIRPPLVYGPDVKANFLSMLNWVSRGVPLPLGAIQENKRSLVYLDNLIDLIKVCIESADAANQIFLVSDDDDVSTAELLKRMSDAFGKKPRLLRVPLSVFNFFGKVLGKGSIGQRLSGSLQVDISHTKSALSWEPPYSMRQGLKQTADWYRSINR